MRTERKPFIPISADIDDDKLEKLAQDKGVSTLVTPQDLPQPGRDNAQPQAEPVIDPETIPTPRSQMKNLNVEVPDYVWRDLKIRAAHRQTSVRHVLMLALKDLGVPIRDADLSEDGRQMRGKVEGA